MIPRLTRQDYPEAPEWFGRYLESAAPVFERVANPIGGSSRQLEPKTLTTLPSLEATFARGRVEFKNRLPTAPKKVSLARCIPDPMPDFAQETWQSPALLNGWVNFGSGFADAAYCLRNGRVWLKGLLKNGTVASNAFVLPVGFRPAENIVFVTDGANAHASGRIDSTGGVRMDVGSNGFFTLENVSFEPAPGTWTSIGPFGTPIWEMTTGGLIAIRYIAGLSPSTKYQLTFEVE